MTTGVGQDGGSGSIQSETLGQRAQFEPWGVRSKRVGGGLSQ